MMKVVLYWFYQSLAPFNILTVEGCSQRRLFRNFSNRVFSPCQSDDKMWWKCCRADFRSVWDHSICWLSKGILDFLDICVTTPFALCNFKKTSAMRIMFICKILKTWCSLQKSRKNWQKCFCFLDNFFRIGCCNFFLISREYLSLAVNVLTTSPKIPDITKRESFQPNFPESHWKIL